MSSLLTVSEQEEERMEKLHAVEVMVFGSRIRCANDPGSILDVGCGSGIWAREVAKAFPKSEVLGVDISPTYVSDHPDNLAFEVTNFVYLH